MGRARNRLLIINALALVLWLLTFSSIWKYSTREILLFSHDYYDGNVKKWLSLTQGYIVGETDNDVFQRRRMLDGSDYWWVPLAQQANWEQLVSTNNDNMNASSGFCVPWTINTDEWWTHHVEWEQGYEDDTHYCFRRIRDRRKARVWRQIYENQFNASANCSNAVYKKMWNSGFGADMHNVLDGLAEGVEVLHRPMQVAQMPWHYALPKPPYNQSNTPLCPSQNMYCFFLNLTHCPQVPRTDEMDKIVFFRKERVIGTAPYTAPMRWYLDYIRRPQTWLRRRIYEFVRNQTTIQTPCTVMHVRRADVVMHLQHSRRYFAIAEYMNSSEQIEPNILLLTDDHNAVGEAMTLFPEYNWMYIERPRYRANESGFEQHIPSQDPAFEMTVLLGTLRLVRRCTSMIRSASNFGDLIWGEILEEHGVWQERVDHKPNTRIYSGANSQTVNVSKAYM